MAVRMKVEDAIEDVLKRYGALSCNDIKRYIQKEGLARLGGKTPVNTIRACIVRAPEKFVRVGAGVYTLKTKSVPTSSRNDKNQDEPTSIRYQYTEKLIEMSNGNYCQIMLNDMITGIIVEKSQVAKALKIEFPEFTNDKLPCIYILSINTPQKKIYVGETYEALVRMGRWNRVKNYTHGAIIYAGRLTSGNIRKNIERVVMEAFEKVGWKTENKTKIMVDLGPEEKYPYEQIKKNIPLVISKIITVFEAFSGSNEHAREQKKNPEISNEKQKQEKETWSAAYRNADPAVREMVTQANQTIKTHTGCSTFERAWLYFADGKPTRKQAFAALRIVGRGKLDLVFLAPETDALPENTRRVKPFVLSHSSECRLRLDQTNLEDVGKISAKSCDYMRSLNKTGK